MFENPIHAQPYEDATLYFLHLKHDGAAFVKINMKHVHFKSKKVKITLHFRVVWVGREWDTDKRNEERKTDNRKIGKYNK